MAESYNQKDNLKYLPPLLGGLADEIFLDYYQNVPVLNTIEEKGPFHVSQLNAFKEKGPYHMSQLNVFEDICPFRKRQLNTLRMLRPIKVLPVPARAFGPWIRVKLATPDLRLPFYMMFTKLGVLKNVRTYEDCIYLLYEKPEQAQCAISQARLGLLYNNKNVFPICDYVEEIVIRKLDKMHNVSRYPFEREIAYINACNYQDTIDKNFNPERNVKKSNECKCKRRNGIATAKQPSGWVLVLTCWISRLYEWIKLKINPQLQ